MINIKLWDLYLISYTWNHLNCVQKMINIKLWDLYLIAILETI